MARLIDGAQARMPRPYSRLLAAVTAHRASLRTLNASQLRAVVDAVRLGLQTEGLCDAQIARAFALIGLVCERTLHVQIFDTQIIAARIVLDNRLAEMATGEGKTYALALAAATAALAGIPVHVVTANDYLVSRDADLLRPVYSALGLTTGAAVGGQVEHDRRAAYACAITYCTAKELVFDYLRDGMRRKQDPLRPQVHRLTHGERPLLRGLCMALLDEADSILVDEARIPLILAQPARNPQQIDYLNQALELTNHLTIGHDFTLDHASRTGQLTEQGRERIEALIDGLAPVWRNRMHREETVNLALAALHLYHRDRHYLVQDGKVVIIDEITGRVASARAWSRGLHQLVEIKEGQSPTLPQVTAAQITYQRFFPRYLRLGGLSGTLTESARELLAHYDLAVRRVPLRLPDRRLRLATRMFADRKTLWTAVAHRVAELRRNGRPVLIGTDCVEDSETLSRHLNAVGIPHAVLNARHHAAEAQIVARAGQQGAVTVATNMAGRGTHVSLAKDTAERGGLHVISCQLNAARRIDRQLAGRCARQGQPGSWERWFAADAALLCAALPRGVRRVLAVVSPLMPSWVLNLLLTTLQRRVERQHVQQRKQLLEHDRALARQLSFGAPLE